MFQAVCASQHTERWERYAPSRKVHINREYIFRSLSIKNFLDAIMWDLHVCPVDLTSRVRGQFVSSTFWASLTHPYGVPELPMRKQVAEVCLRALVAILWLLWWSDIQLYIGQWLCRCEPPTCFRNSKGWPKTLGVRSKKQLLDGFSSGC